MPDLGAIGTRHPFPAAAGRTLITPTPPQFAMGTLDPASARSGVETIPGYVRCVVIQSIGPPRDPLLLNDFHPALSSDPHQHTARDDEVGNPSPPSQRQTRPGIFTSLMPVTAGARTISVDVKLVSPDPNNNSPATALLPFPRITVRANPEVGLHADVVFSAVATYEWQTLTASFVATAPGVVELWREKRCLRMDDVMYWDNLRVT